jgi:hypothetical protein
MLLSIDWDCYSGCVEHVFDAPIWGTPDRGHDRLDAWRVRASKRDGAKRGGAAAGWEVLEADFPLFSGHEALQQYAGKPAYVTLSHAQAREWLELYPGREVLNLDSHHDLYSGSGDQAALARWRPGNWAGLGLASGLISSYTVRYPAWHQALMVAEGHDLERTQAELSAALEPAVLGRVRLERGPELPAPAEVEAVILVQSPAWCSPAHDGGFFRLAHALSAATLEPGPLPDR